MEIGYVKTLKADDGKEIKLVGNALTFILNKNYFGRDLLNDIILFACKNNNENILKEIKKLAGNEHNVVYNMDRLTEEQQVKVLNSMSNYTFDSEFTLNLIATLMATVKYPEKVDIIDMIVQIPPYFLCDREIISSLMDFLVKFTQKKVSKYLYRPRNNKYKGRFYNTNTVCKYKIRHRSKVKRFVNTSIN